MSNVKPRVVITNQRYVKDDITLSEKIAVQPRPEWKTRPNSITKKCNYDFRICTVVCQETTNQRADSTRPTLADHFGLITVRIGLSGP